MAHERPTGATPDEIKDLSYAEQGHFSLAATEANLREMLEPILAKARPLQEALATVEAHRDLISKRAEEIRWKIDERQREAARRAKQAEANAVVVGKRGQEEAAWQIIVRRVFDQVNYGSGELTQSHDPLANEVGKVLARVLGSEDFVWQLPNMVEKSLGDAVTRTGNEVRLKITTGDDSCRLLLLADGKFGVVYNPKPDSDGAQALMHVAQSISLPKGEVVNPHIFGVQFDTHFVMPFVTSMRDSSQKARGRIPRVIPAGLTEETAPLVHSIREVLATGDIHLPKKFGKATIPYSANPQG